MSRIKFSQLIPAAQTDLDNDTIFAVVNLGISKKTTITEVKNFLITQGLATQAYVNTSVSTAIANLIGSAPDILNTLEELANAINNQADFASSIQSYVDSKVSELFGFKTTDDLDEGLINRYFTESRSRASISVDDPSNSLTYNPITGVLSFDFNSVSLVSSVNGKAGVVVLNTDDVNEGATNRYFTETRSRSSIGVVDPSSTLIYNSASGVLTFNANALVRSVNGQQGIVTLTTTNIAEGVNQYFTQARSRQSISVTDPSGALTYNSTTGVLTFDSALTNLVTSVNGQQGVVVLDTDDVAEANNLYFTQARSRSSISVNDPLGRLAYNSSTGVLTFTANSLVTSVAGRTGAVTLNTSDVAESTNLYFTQTRSRQSISVSDTSGSLTYNNSTGVLTFNSALANLVTSVNGQQGVVVLDTDDVAEGTTNRYFTNTRARSALSAGTGVTYNSTTGVISIGQNVGTTSSPSFSAVTVTGGTESTSTATGAVVVTGGVGISGNLNVGGTITHNGIIPSEGTNIDQIKTIVVNMRLEAEWLDTGINNGILTTGTYAIQLYANDVAVGGTNNNEYYSGIMSWYSGDPDSTDVQPTDEIPLHRAGGSNEGSIYLRTYRTLSADDKDLKLQIFSNYDLPAASNYTFKFRRLI